MIKVRREGAADVAMDVHNSQRERVRLGRGVGGGGEAAVYRVVGAPDLLAKIYEPAPRPGYDRKLAWMQANPPDDPTRALGHTSIAWPLDLLYNGRGQFIGYVMHYIKNAVSLLEVFNPRLRAQTLPSFDWRYLHRTARNLAVALSALHAHGYVVGDLNESNVMVTPSAMVTLIDTDSFQVRARKWGRSVTFYCPVGKPEYTPPELQGRSFQNTRQYPEHDCFGLGVLIFQLLMGGSHPFRAQWLGQDDPPPIEEKIRRGAFPHMRSPPLPVAPPRNGSALNALHPQVVDLVYRCFVEGHKSPRRRPTPDDWESAITAAEKGLVSCAEGHCYSNHLSACPWCFPKQRSLRVPLPSTRPVIPPSGRAFPSLVVPRPYALRQMMSQWWWRARRRLPATVTAAAREIIHGSIVGAAVWAAGGTVFGTIGGGIAGLAGPLLIWVVIWALLWASGWWAFGELLGEMIGGRSLGKTVGVGGAIGGAAVGGGLGWVIGQKGFEELGGWPIVKAVLSVITWATGRQELQGVLGEALVGAISGALIWGAIWALAGAIGGAFSCSRMGRRAFGEGLARVPGKGLGVLWATAGAIEGGSVGAVIGVMVGGIVGGIVGLTAGNIGEVSIRMMVGSVVGSCIGAVGGTLGARHVEGIERRLGKALGVVEAMVGLAVGLLVARGGLALWAEGGTEYAGALEGALVGLVSGALIGLISGALVGAAGGAIVRATEL